MRKTVALGGLGTAADPALELTAFPDSLQLGRWFAACSTRMWANAQRDGRPAEYSWRPLFNAAKFG